MSLLRGNRLCGWVVGAALTVSCRTSSVDPSATKFTAGDETVAFMTAVFPGNRDTKRLPHLADKQELDDLAFQASFVSEHPLGLRKTWLVYSHFDEDGHYFHKALSTAHLLLRETNPPAQTIDLGAFVDWHDAARHALTAYASHGDLRPWPPTVSPALGYLIQLLNFSRFLAPKAGALIQHRSARAFLQRIRQPPSTWQAWPSQLTGQQSLTQVMEALTVAHVLSRSGDPAGGTHAAFRFRFQPLRFPSEMPDASLDWDDLDSFRRTDVFYDAPAGLRAIPFDGRLPEALRLNGTQAWGDAILAVVADALGQGRNTGPWPDGAVMWMAPGTRIGAIRRRDAGAVTARRALYQDGPRLHPCSAACPEDRYRLVIESYAAER